MNFEKIEDPILLLIEQYKNHPSILAINANFTGNQFSFQYFSESEIKRENFSSK